MAVYEIHEVKSNVPLAVCLLENNTPCEMFKYVDMHHPNYDSLKKSIGDSIREVKFDVSAGIKPCVMSNVCTTQHNYIFYLKDIATIAHMHVVTVDPLYFIPENLHKSFELMASMNTYQSTFVLSRWIPIEYKQMLIDAGIINKSVNVPAGCVKIY